MITAQWKILYNGTESAIADIYPGDRWTRIADTLDGRGGHAVLYGRTINEADILGMLADTTGWIRLGDRAISPWQILSEIN